MTEVRRAGIEDIPALAEILADAFSDDAAMSWVMGGPPAPRLFATMIRITYMPKGDCYISDDGAAALWLAGDLLTAEPFSNSLRLLPVMLANGGLKTIPRGLGAQARMQKFHPHAAHQYLFAVGVRQQAQGKGLGKKILAPMLDRCDAEGVGAYLENSKQQNNNFYRGLGFEFSADAFALGKDAPSIQPMWREAR